MDNANELLENTVQDTSSSAVENSTADEMGNYSIASYDYYDRYYESVLNKLTAINENQQTIIYNQEQIQLSIKTVSDDVYAGCFILVLLFVYMFLKSILGK